MKKISLVVFVLLIIRVTAFSQSCMPEGITFTTQAQIDSFQVNYLGCTVIEGNVSIGDYLGGTNATNLLGLSVLDSIGGHLIIWNNDSLASLSGLENITGIGGQLGIFNNPALTSLEGLEGLSSVYAVSIENNSTLNNLVGLENLTSIDYILDIEDNPSLTSLQGLVNLNSVVDGHLSIHNNDALTSLDGLNNLVHIGSGLTIEFNNALENITALANLVSVQNDDNWSFIRITNNISLTSLAGLENVDPGSIQELSIGWNVALPDCDVYSICQYLADPDGVVDIRYNAPGCNSREEVEAACLEEVKEVVSR